jgi:CBS-domain-containing membrane protein
LAIGFIAWLGDVSGTPLLIGPFGATCVLLFAMPDSPLSQPANVVGGHLLATGLSLALAPVLPATPMGMAMAVGAALAAMLVLRITHPPAGADPLLVLTLHPDWSFLVVPVLVGSLVLVLMALIIHRLPPVRAYPLPVR